MLKRTLLVVALLLLLSPSQAHAGSCTISTTNLAFGTYNVFSSQRLASTGSISHSCTWQGWEINQGRTYRISISAGQSGNASARRMRRGTEFLAYNVYRDASETQVWGDGTGGTFQYVGTATKGTEPTLIMYGMIPAGQDVRAGTYSDTLTVTVIF